MPRSRLLLTGVAGRPAPRSGGAAERDFRCRSHGDPGGTRRSPKGPPRRGARGSECPVFPANNWWNKDISLSPVHARSRQWLSHMSTSVGSCTPTSARPTATARTTASRSRSWGGSTEGSRCTSTTPDESDRGRYPFGKDTKIEGGRNSGGDMHAVVVQRRTCRLYETWNTRMRGTAWSAGSGATWSLRSNALRRNTLDLRRRCRAADPARPAALERGQRGGGQARDPVHHRRHQQPPPLARAPRRRLAGAASPTRPWGHASG